VGISEVDLYPGRLLDPLVVEHLVALVPGQRAAQTGRKPREGVDKGVADRLGGVPPRKSDQHGEPGLALYQCCDGGSLTGTDDQVAFPVANLAAGLDALRALPDRLHVGGLLQGALTGPAPAAAVPVDPAGAQVGRIGRQDEAAVDGLIDSLGAAIG